MILNIGFYSLKEGVIWQDVQNEVLKLLKRSIIPHINAMNVVM